MPARRESRQFFMSVEGINCEVLYFKHLSKIIRNSGRSSYLLKVDPKKMSPYDFAKRNSHKPREKQRGTTKHLPYIHVQDVEDYHDEKQRQKFGNLLESMKRAERDFGIDYMLGYSNYTFELWMLLHVTDKGFAVPNRHAYLGPINKSFKKTYKKLDEYKKVAEFQSILDEYVTLDTVFLAIGRAIKLEQANVDSDKQRVSFSGYSFFRDSPSLSVHEVVQLMFDTCGVE